MVPHPPLSPASGVRPFPYLEVLTLTLWPRKRAPLAQLAQCPACQCEVAVRVQGPRGDLLAYRHAGEAGEAVGHACECARCGARYVSLWQGGTLAYGRNRAQVASVQAVASAGGKVPGGEGTEGGGSLFGDMVTNLDDPRF